MNQNNNKQRLITITTIAQWDEKKDTVKNYSNIDCHDSYENNHNCKSNNIKNNNKNNIEALWTITMALIRM